MEKIPFDLDFEAQMRLARAWKEYGSPQAVERFCEFFYKGKIFVSHTSADSNWCSTHIIPHLGRFDDYFFLSRVSGDGQLNEHYALIVSAFRFVKTVIVVVSTASIVSEWVSLEMKWSVEQKHPMIVCLKDQSDPSELHSELAAPETWSLSANPPRRVIDFRHDTGVAEQELCRLLKTVEFKSEPNEVWSAGSLPQRHR